MASDSAPPSSKVDFPKLALAVKFPPLSVTDDFNLILLMPDDCKGAAFFSYNWFLLRKASLATLVGSINCNFFGFAWILGNSPCPTSYNSYVLRKLGILKGAWVSLCSVVAIVEACCNSVCCFKSACSSSGEFMSVSKCLSS